MDHRIYLAKKNHGYSISAQSFYFCPRLIQLDILIFTPSHITAPASTGLLIIVHEFFQRQALKQTYSNRVKLFDITTLIFSLSAPNQSINQSVSRGDAAEKSIFCFFPPKFWQF